MPYGLIMTVVVALFAARISDRAISQGNIFRAFALLTMVWVISAMGRQADIGFWIAMGYK